MSADEKMLPAPATAGRPVGFVGGPNAGQARIIPESDGDYVAHDEFIYRIWPFRLKGSGKETLFLACAKDQPPLVMLQQMWEEYSISAQIRGGDFGYMNRVGGDIKSRT